MSAAIFARLAETGVTKDGRDLEVRALVDAHRQMKQAQLGNARKLGPNANGTHGARGQW